MAKAFASQSDMTGKTFSFTEVGNGIYAFTAEGDPNSGVDSVMIIEAQATPHAWPKKSSTACALSPTSQSAIWC